MRNRTFCNLNYDEVLFMNDTVKFLRENAYVDDFNCLYLKVVVIEKEKEKN